MATSTTTQSQAPPAAEPSTNAFPPSKGASLEERPAGLSEPGESLGLIVKIDNIQPSKTNPRKNFSGADFDELVASIKQHGVLQPILVRKRGSNAVAVEGVIPGRWYAAHINTVGNPNFIGTGHATKQAAQQEADQVNKKSHHEIVCGERRWRAAKAAGLKEIPAVCRSIGDVEALELQIVENLQRKDVTALEEAAGFVALFKEASKDSKEPKAATVEAIAKKVGKSVRYVYARMKLEELAPEVKKAVESGAIAPSHADEIVRLQPADQKRALDFCLINDQTYGRPQKRQEAPSIRDLKRFLSDQVLVDLKDAPFDIDDAKLLPAAGACSACPKLAKNSILHQGSGVAGNTCTDSACFAEKSLELVKINAADVLKKEGVEPVMISLEWGGDNKKRRPGVLYSGDFNTYGYAGGNYGPIRKDGCKDTKLGLYVEGREIGRAVWICTAKGQCKDHRYSSTHGQSSGSSNDAALRREQRIQKYFRAEVFKALRAKATKLSHDDWVAIGVAMFRLLGHYIEQPMLTALGWEKGVGGHQGTIKSKLAAFTDVEIQTHLLLFAVGDELTCALGSNESPGDLTAAAKRFGIDVAPFLEAAKAKFAPKAKAKKVAAAKKEQSTKAGKCRVCGCVKEHACVLGYKGKKPLTCAWADDTKTLCNNPECLKKAKAENKSDAKKPVAKKAKVAKKPALTKKGGRK